MYALSKIAGIRRRLLFYKSLLSIPVLSNTQKTRLAIVTGELEVGGVGRVLLNIIDGLPRSSYEIFIFTTDPRINNWAPEFKKRVDRIIDIPRIIGMSLPQGYTRKFLEKYLRKNRFDLVFITNSIAGYQALPRVKHGGASQNVRVYDLLHTHGRPEDEDAFLKISVPFDRYINERIVISDYLKKYYSDNYPVDAAKIKVIRNGIDTKSVAIAPDSKRGRKYLELGRDENAISFLGRLQEDKSPQRLVELAYMLRGELRQHKTIIAIVGEGSMADGLKQRAKSLGVLGDRLRFYSFTDHPLDVCAASSYTIITSDLEGIPMSALESMQVYTPVIAPAVGGLPEIIEDGKDGFLAYFDDTGEEERLRSLAHAIKRALALDNKATEEMRNCAHKKVSARFSSMSKEYCALFEGTDNISS